MYSIRSATVKFNVFNHNTVLSNSDDNTNNAYGGGLYLSRGTIENNTFYANADVSFSNTGGKGSGYYCHYAPTSFKNNLFVNHATSVRANSDGKGIATSDQGQYTVNDCGFYNNDTDIGDDALSGTNVSGNPQFTDAGNNDFTLQYNSPYVDAGNGDYTYDETTNHDYGWKYDIGAEEYSGSRVLQSVSGTGEILFGGKVRAKINVTTLGTLSELDLTIHENENHTNAPTSVKRWISISPTGSGYTCNVTLSYKDSELNGETEANLKMYRWNGSSWEGPKTTTSISAENNYLTCEGQTSFSDWIMDADGATPVELTSFTAASTGLASIELNWTTATEVDNYGFDVESKRASTDEWITLSFVEGHGNSYSPKEYSFIDSDKLTKTVKYRLKQIDIDGAFEYSKIIKVEMDLPTEFKLNQNYPNPFNPSTTISYGLPFDSKVKVEIFDILGQRVDIIANGVESSGVHSTLWDAVHLASGIYIIRINATSISSKVSFTKSMKMILMK